MKIKVSEMSHNELVSIFSVGLSGSSYLGCSYDKDFYSSLSEDMKDGNCIEDKMADCLLHGGTITLIDCEEDEDYTMNMEEFIERLNLAIQKDESILSSLVKIIDENDGGDYYDGDAVLQGIMFGEVVYG